MNRIHPPPIAQFDLPAACGGQIVTESYASADGRLWRFVRDRSDPDAAPRFACVRWDDIDADHPAENWEVGDRSPPPIAESEWEAWEPSSATAPVDWSAGKQHAYIACCYGRDGDEPGDCYIRVGRDSLGFWWIDDGDDDERGYLRGPFRDAAAADETAAEWAAEQDEGDDSPSAAAMLERSLRATAGDPDPAGPYAVWWETVGDDAHIVDRYPSRDAADAAARLANDELRAHHPGGRLLCGYEVRVLHSGEWEGIDD